MALDRGRADAQVRGNFLIRLGASYQIQNSRFRRSQITPWHGHSSPPGFGFRETCYVLAIAVMVQITAATLYSHVIGFPSR